VRLDQGHKHPGVDLDQRRPPRASGGPRVTSLGRGHATDNSSSAAVVVFALARQIIVYVR
jgi:hypothetical protein